MGFHLAEIGFRTAFRLMGSGSGGYTLSSIRFILSVGERNEVGMYSKKEGGTH